MHYQSEHTGVSTSRGLLTYFAGYVKLDDLVGHAPDVRCRNQSGHFQLQREEIKESSAATHRVPISHSLLCKKRPKITGALTARVFVALRGSLITISKITVTD